MAERLGYRGHAGLRAVERFMKHYFLVAKEVGELTRIVCSALEMKQLKSLPSLGTLLVAVRLAAAAPSSAAPPTSASRTAASTPSTRTSSPRTR